MKYTASIAAISALVLMLVSAAHAAPKTLKSYRSSYKKGLAQIESANSAAREKALATYGRDLVTARDRLRRDGNLEGMLAAKKEIERFNTENSVPAESPDDFPELLVLVRKRYHDSVAAADQAKARNTIALGKRYLVLLESLKKHLVRQSNLEKAQEVAAEMKQVEAAIAAIQVETDLTALDLPAHLRKGLVLYYSFNKTMPGKVTDESGKKNHAVVHGATWTERGRVGGACKFDGVDDYIETPHDSSLTPTTLTVSAWVKVASIPKADLILVGKAQDYRGYGLVLQSWNVNYDDVKPCIGSNGRWVMIEGRKPEAGTWRHYAMTVDGKTLKFYVNGEQYGPAKDTGGAITHSTGSLIIGKHYSRSGAGRHLEGLVDEVMVWNRTLSKTEIKQLHAAAGKPPARPAMPAKLSQSLALHYSFDRDRGSTIVDKSAKLHHGTARETAWTKEGRFGGGCRFDGKGQITVSPAKGINRSASVTMAAWVRFDQGFVSPNGRAVMAIGKTDPAAHFEIRGFSDPSWNFRECPGGATPRFALGADDGSSDMWHGGGSPTRTDTWYHVAATYEKNKRYVALYVNGTRVKSSHLSKPLNLAPIVTIGNGAYRDQYLKGTLDDVMIWTRALSEAEIRELYELE